MSYKKLRIFELSEKLRNELYNELIKIPKRWSIVEVDQVVRSSASVVANIVEGYGRKVYQKEFFRFLSMSLASSDETQNHVRALRFKGYLNNQKADYFEFNYQSLSVKILNMMDVIKVNAKF